MRAAVAEDIRNILTAPSRSEAERLRDLTVTKYSASCSRLAQWMQSALPEGFTVFILPKNQRRLLRTTNMLERVNKKIKRRTRVARRYFQTKHPCSAWSPRCSWKSAKTWKREKST